MKKKEKSRKKTHHLPTTFKTKEMLAKSMREVTESHKICFGFSMH